MTPTDPLSDLKARLLIALKIEKLERIGKHPDCSIAFINNLVYKISRNFKGKTLKLFLILNFSYISFNKYSTSF